MKLSARIKALPDWIIEKFKTFRVETWAEYCVCLFFTGIFVNIVSNYSFKFFVLHQVLLIAATTMLVYAMKSFFCDMELFQSSSGMLNKNPELSSLYKNRLLPLQRTAWPLLAAIVVAGFFFICIFLLEYIALDSVGIYALYIAGTSVLLGVYGYVQYLYFLWFIYKAGKCEYTDYDKYAPAETSWVIQIAKTSQRLRSYFLFIGLIYVIEYGILVPTDKITITNASISLQMPNNMAFIVSWIALFVLVIVAFPIINHIQYKIITRLVSRLKDRTISDVSHLMNSERDSEKDKKDRLTAVVTYSVIIENIRKSKSYPISRALSFDFLMTFVTVVVHFMNFYNKIASVPQLSALFTKF